jgi:MFS family permease
VVLDKFGVRKVGRVGTLLWSVASFAAAATTSVGGFFAARLLLGVGEAPTFPANAKAIGLWFPARERSFATSIFDAAAKFASAIGVPLIGFVLLKVGWRLSFALTGVLSLGYFVLFWRVYRDPAEDMLLSAAEREYAQERAGASLQKQPVDSDKEVSGALGLGALGLGALLRQRKVIGLALGFGAYNYVFYLLLTWLPTYFSSALHVDLMDSFLYTGVPWLFATITDLVVGGWLVDALIRRGWESSRVRKTVLIAGTAFGLGILGAGGAHTPLRALVWISISIGGLAAAAPVGWSIPSLIAAPANVGKVGGIVNFSNQISGIAAPILTGYLVVAAHGSFAWAFGVSAAYLCVGIAGYIVLLGRIERAPSAVSGVEKGIS